MMVSHLLFKWLSVSISLFSYTASAFLYELTFNVDAGKVECFHQYVVMKGVLEIHYQVLQGGEMDIDFSTRSPGNEILRYDERSRTGTHQVYTKEGGTYEFCFDNSFSQFTPKMVFFELYSELQEISFVNGESYAEKFETSEVEADVKNRMKQSFVQIKSSLSIVRSKLGKIKNSQSHLRGYMKRDRSITEANFSRVNLFSGFYMIMMITVSMVQVVTIRSLFKPPSHQMKQAT